MPVQTRNGVDYLRLKKRVGVFYPVKKSSRAPIKSPWVNLVDLGRNIPFHRYARTPENVSYFVRVEDIKKAIQQHIREQQRTIKNPPQRWMQIYTAGS